MIKRSCYIYFLLDPSGKKGYVGKSYDPIKRADAHWYTRFKRTYYVHNWLRTLASRPQLIVLEECTEKNWKRREQVWIRDLKLGGLKLTNLTEGGDGTTGCSEETREKLRVGSLGNKNGKGWKPTPEQRAKISAATRRQMAAGNHPMQGKKHSGETKKRWSIIRKGRRISEAAKRKMSISHRGKVFTEEHKTNMKKNHWRNKCVST